MKHRFTATALYLWSSLLIWMSTFLTVYVFAALACARHFADARLLGLGVVPLVTTIVTFAAAGITAYLLRAAYRRMHTMDDEHARFIHFVVLATSALALIGLMYLALPPLLLASQCEGGA